MGLLEERAAQAEVVKRAIWGFVNSQTEDEIMLPAIQFLCNREHLLVDAICDALSKGSEG